MEGVGGGTRGARSRLALCGFSLSLSPPSSLAAVKCGGERGGANAWRKATPRCCSRRRRWSAVLCRARAARPCVLGSRPAALSCAPHCPCEDGMPTRRFLASTLPGHPLSSSQPNRGDALVSRLALLALVRCGCLPVKQHVPRLL